GVQTFAHGLGAMPSRVECFMEAKAANAGWSTGDRQYIGGSDLALVGENNYAQRGFGMGWNATGVWWSLLPAKMIYGIQKDTGATITFTITYWKLVLVAHP